MPLSQAQTKVHKISDVIKAPALVMSQSEPTSPVIHEYNAF